MADVGELILRIKADASQLEREFRRVNGLVQQGGKQMGGAMTGLAAQLRQLGPALGVAAFVQFGRRAVDAAGNVKDLADSMGFAASTLAALESPLVAVGGSLDGLAASVSLMNNALGEAAKGGQEAIKAFDTLGLSVRKLQAMTPEQQFYEVTRALAGLENQYQMTEAGRAIFGRGFAKLIPLIKESNGELRETVRAAQDVGSALGEDTIARIDAFGDAMSGAAIRARNSFLEAFAAVLKATEAVGKFLPSAEEASRARLSNYGITDVGRRLTAQDLWRMKSKAGGFVTEASPPPAPGAGAGDARGSNAALLKSSGGGGGGRSSPKELAEDYDTLTRSVDDYVAAMEQENALLQMNERDRAGAKAVLEANSLAMKEGNLLTEESKEKIRQLAEKQHDLRSAMDKTGDSAVINAKLVKDSFADALESALFDFKNFGSAAGGILDGIARNIARKGFIDPLSKSASGLLGGLFGGGGNPFITESARPSAGFVGPMPGSFLGFADGGSPPVGMPSIVGERGPEIFVPKSAGTIVPNHALGGQTVSVTHVWNIQGGVTRADLAGMMPAIEARSTAATLAAIERGGRAAQIVGRKG